MLKSEIKVGEQYTLREGRRRWAPLQRVRILQHVRGQKGKADWIDANLGLGDYVEGQNLLVRWKDHKAPRRDEEPERQRREENPRHAHKEDCPVWTWGGTT